MRTTELSDKIWPQGLVDKIEGAIDDSEARTRTAVWMGAAFVAVVTPAAVYAVNKLL